MGNKSSAQHDIPGAHTPVNTRATPISKKCTESETDEAMKEPLRALSVIEIAINLLKNTAVEIKKVKEKIKNNSFVRAINDPNDLFSTELILEAIRVGSININEADKIYTNIKETAKEVHSAVQKADEVVGKIEIKINNTNTDTKQKQILTILNDVLKKKAAYADAKVKEANIAYNKIENAISTVRNGFGRNRVSIERGEEQTTLAKAARNSAKSRLSGGRRKHRKHRKHRKRTHNSTHRKRR
jgi:hypothetical protein